MRTIILVAEDDHLIRTVTGRITHVRILVVKPTNPLLFERALQQSGLLIDPPLIQALISALLTAWRSHREGSAMLEPPRNSPSSLAEGKGSPTRLTHQLQRVGGAAGPDPMWPRPSQRRISGSFHKDPSRIVARFIDLAAVKVKERITVVGAAEELGVSVRHLSRLCLALVGIPPGMVLRSSRMKSIARSLEATDDKIVYIAKSHGISESAGMIRQFRRLLGLTPGLYRTLHRKKLEA